MQNNPVLTFTFPIRPFKRCFPVKLAVFFLTLCNALSVTTASADTIRDRLLIAADNKVSGAYVRDRFLALMKKPFDAESKNKKALLIGDSHAQDFLNTVLESGSLSGYQIRTRYIPVRCQMFLDASLSKNIKPKDSAFCRDSDTLEKAADQIAEADLIILAANWKLWSANHLAKTIEAMKLKKQQKVVVIGKKSFGKINIRKYLRLPEDKLLKLRNRVDAGQMKINSALRESLPKSQFVDVHALLCGSGDTCPLFTPRGDLISFDGGHLTPAGASYIGHILFKQSVLAHL